MPKNYRIGRRKSRSGGKIAAVITAAAITAVAVAAAVLTLLQKWDGIFADLGLKEPPVVSPETVYESDNVFVHFISVGQGDCELIVSGGVAVLIDCGEKECAEYVVSYLKQLNIEKLDCVIATHPHADHIGAMEAVIDEFKPDRLLMPKVRDDITPITATFVRMLDAAERNNTRISYVRAGMTSIELGGAYLEFIAPVFNTYDNLNDYSAVVRLVHGGVKFLFTGDIENPAEKDILTSGADISADVLKVAHHGSKTSSSDKFLKAVGGSYAVIEVGAGNSYGHPTEETLSRLKKWGYQVYRTDISGNIVFESDSENIIIHTKG